MTTASDPQVTNELLSAYIDEAVSEEERRLIESAVAKDPQVAWRLASLQATVRLLHELPELSLPRSFLLTPEQVEQPLQPVVVAAAARPPAGVGAGGFWQEIQRGWQQLWQGGSPALRNAMAASFAVLLALLLAPRFFAPPSLPTVGQVQTVAIQMPAAMQKAAPRLDADEKAPPVEAAAGESGEMMSGAAAQAQSATEVAAAEPASSAESGLAALGTATAAAVESAVGSAAEAAEPPAMETAPVVAEDAEGAAGMAAAEAEAPAEAAAAMPAAAMPAAAAAPAPELAQGVTLAQSASGASVLDDMQRQAGGSASVAAGGGTADSITIASAAPPDASVADAAAAAAAAVRPPATGGAPLSAAAANNAAPLSPLAATATDEPTAAPPSTPATAPTSAPTTAPTAAVAMAPAEVQASDQVQVVEPAAAPVSAGSPAWLLLALQGSALLAGVATMVFGLLWWRSRE